MAILENSSVLVQRVFNSPARAVFEAIGQGILFQTCGANPATIKIDFRAGGRFTLHFEGYGALTGEFLEIAPYEKIAFSWDRGTRVTIGLEALSGSATQMTLEHVGLADDDFIRAVDHGWRDGINDFSPRIGRSLRLTREFSAPLDQVFKICGSPKLFAGCGAILDSGTLDFRVGGKYSYQASGCGGIEGDYLHGEYTDIILGKRIAFTWNSKSLAGPTGETLVLLDFTDLGDGRTRLELTHAGFPSDSSRDEHEGGWGGVLDGLTLAS